MKNKNGLEISQHDKTLCLTLKVSKKKTLRVLNLDAMNANRVIISFQIMREQFWASSLGLKYLNLSNLVTLSITSIYGLITMWYIIVTSTTTRSLNIDHS